MGERDKASLLDANYGLGALMVKVPKPWLASNNNAHRLQVPPGPLPVTSLLFCAWCAEPSTLPSHPSHTANISTSNTGKEPSN